jgi:hypothetical protein
MFTTSGDKIMNDMFYDEYGMITMIEHLNDGNIKIFTLDKRRGNSSRRLINNKISEHGLVTVYSMNENSLAIIENSYIGYMETQDLCVPRIKKLDGEYYLDHVSDEFYEIINSSDESLSYNDASVVWNNDSVTWTSES